MNKVPKIGQERLENGRVLNSRYSKVKLLAGNPVAAVSAVIKLYFWVGGSPWLGFLRCQSGQIREIFGPKHTNFEGRFEHFPVVEFQKPTDF